MRELIFESLKQYITAETAGPDKKKKEKGIEKNGEMDVGCDYEFGGKQHGFRHYNYN
jgi:hypothetical protein